jgi:hypothetical protein
LRSVRRWERAAPSASLAAVTGAVIVGVVGHTGRGVVGLVGVVVTIVGLSAVLVDMVRVRTATRRDERLARAVQRFRELDREQRKAVFVALRGGQVNPDVAPLLREQAYRVVAQPRPVGAVAGTVLVGTGLVLARGFDLPVDVLALAMFLNAGLVLRTTGRQRARARRLLDS